MSLAPTPSVELIGEDPSVLKEVSCRGCGAKLRYGLKAVYSRGHTDYTGDTDWCDYIRCSRCSHEIKVS